MSKPRAPFAKPKSAPPRRCLTEPRIGTASSLGIWSPTRPMARRKTSPGSSNTSRSRRISRSSINRRGRMARSRVRTSRGTLMRTATSVLRARTCFGSAETSRRSAPASTLTACAVTAPARRIAGSANSNRNAAQTISCARFRGTWTKTRAMWRGLLPPRLNSRSRPRRRKKVEMLFAHLKRILGLGRLRLRGPSVVNDEFLLAATAPVEVIVFRSLRRFAASAGRQATLDASKTLLPNSLRRRHWRCARPIFVAGIGQHLIRHLAPHISQSSIVSAFLVCRGASSGRQGISRSLQAVRSFVRRMKSPARRRPRRRRAPARRTPACRAPPPGCRRSRGGCAPAASRA